MADLLVLKMTQMNRHICPPDHTSHMFGRIEHALQSRKANQYNPKKDQVDNLQCFEESDK